MAMITATTARYIKLRKAGLGGRFAKTWRIHFGHGKISHEMALVGNRKAIKQARIDQGRDARTAAEDAREIFDFYHLGSDCLWITFAKGGLWWTFAEPEVTGSERAKATVNERERRLTAGQARTSMEPHWDRMA